MSTISSPSPLLAETLQRAELQRSSREPTATSIAAWLQNGADDAALLPLLSGCSPQRATTLLADAIELTTKEGAAIDPLVARRAQILKSHLAGTSPPFDAVHRSGAYTYTNTDQAGPLAHTLTTDGRLNAEAVSRLAGTEVIIDLGCGSLRDAIAYAKRFPNALVIGVDSSPTALEISEERKRGLPQDIAERIFVVSSDIHQFLLGGRDSIKNLIGFEPGKVGLTASSSLHFTPEDLRGEVQTGIFELIGEDGWYAGLHRTTEDPFGRPGLLLHEEDGERVHIHGEDGLARKFWNLKTQKRHVHEAGGDVVQSEEIVTPYSTIDDARFGFIFAIAAATEKK